MVSPRIFTIITQYKVKENRVTLLRIKSNDVLGRVTVLFYINCIGRFETTVAVQIWLG
jgi:hypothetical protein